MIILLGVLRRRVGFRKPRKTILVFCEDEVTEPLYLEALRKDPQVKEAAAVDLRVHNQGSGSVPFVLVQNAAAAKKRAIDEESEIDEVWCLFDVEWPRNHPRLKDAVQLARKSGVRLAISNPCFEIWLILHYGDHTSWIDTAAAKRKRRRCDGNADKNLDARRYMPLRATAADRAARLDEQHRRNGTSFPKNNPSSGMHLLLRSLERSSP